MTKKELLVLASEAGIVNRHRMNKGSLVEALLPTRIYQSLPEAPGIIRDLGRRDLMELCALAGKTVGRSWRKADLLRALEDQIGSMQEGGEVDSVVAAAPGVEDVEELLPTDEVAVAEPLAELTRLPQSYAKSSVVLLPVHPYLVHVYWEIADRDLEEARSRFGRARDGLESVLRFFDVSTTLSDSAPHRDFFDVKIELDAGQWYVDLWSPNRSYYVELGLRSRRGRFLPLCRSKVAVTPPAWPSIEGDERYVRVDHQGEIVEVEVLEDRHSQGSEMDLAERLGVGRASGPGWIFESGRGLDHSADERDEQERPEGPSHSPNGAGATPGGSRFDLTDLCERIAEPGVSSGSRLCAKEDDTADF